ncbi:sphingomyelin phosphodiesterase-like [Ornithodoros turicata]|uniref:sphingomyelin phosphodiesterase-like n=1 Tax=Ornithodoros turicata TaxID=34597 RepID=UPI003138EA8C
MGQLLLIFPLIDDEEEQYARKSRWLYDVLANSWTQWLSASALESVRSGGYYVARPREGLRVLSVNMNFCYFFNFWLIVNSTDPGGQLEWLIQQLTDAEDAGDKVHIIGHIPPGIIDCIETWSTMFHRIVERFEDTITGQFYGHTHYDEFAVFYSSENRAKAISVAYIAPSATTYSYLNPGYRIYNMDGQSKEITGHETYIMNLTEANLVGEPTWRLEYATQDIGIASSSPSEWDSYVSRMEADDKLFEDFYGHFMKLSDHPRNCTGICKERMICHLKTDRSHDYSKCSEMSA